jgi:hypothetical protein
MGGAASAIAPAPVEEKSEIDELMDLLSDPKNMVVVTRTFPSQFVGRKVDVKCGTFRCPTIVERLQEDVFSRFGGENFTVDVCPRTPNGESKIMASFQLNNEGCDPLDGSGNPIEPSQEWSEQRRPFDPRRTIPLGSDPTLIEDTSPLGLMKKSLQSELSMATDRKQIAEIKRQIREIEEEEAEARESRQARKKPAVVENDPRDAKIAELERKVAAEEKKKEDDRLTRIETALAKILEGGVAGAQKEDPILKIMLANQQSADRRIELLMKSQSDALTAALTNKPEKKDTMAELFANLKNMKDAFGGDNSRVKHLEEKIFDLAFDRLADGTERGGASDDEDDIAKYTVKQAVPLFSKYLERQIEKDKEKGVELTAERQKQLMEEATRKVAEDLAAKGMIVKDPAKALPAPAPKPQPTAQPKPKGDDVKVPPGPQSPEYNRKNAVNFVLDVALSDIKKGCPRDSFLPGDILDRLDGELLEQFSRIESGTDLETFLQPHADPARYAALKDAANKDQGVKRWLRDMLFTTKDAYIDMKSQAVAQAMAQAAAAQAPPATPK